jgi:hypothetical protein
MKKGSKILILALMMLYILPQDATAQNKTTTQQKTAKTPKWVAMMDDTTANYFEAVENFNNYWSNREKPMEEKELFNSPEKAKEKKTKKTPNMEYTFEYKKFKKWQIETLPYVKSDGTILTPSERIQQWKEEKQKRIQKK